MKNTTKFVGEEHQQRRTVEIYRDNGVCHIYGTNTFKYKVSMPEID
jgi:hypothetical protein